MSTKSPEVRNVETCVAALNEAKATASKTAMQLGDAASKLDVARAALASAELSFIADESDGNAKTVTKATERLRLAELSHRAVIGKLETARSTLQTAEAAHVGAVRDAARADAERDHSLETFRSKVGPHVAAVLGAIDVLRSSAAAIDSALVASAGATRTFHELGGDPSVGAIDGTAVAGLLLCGLDKHGAIATDPNLVRQALDPNAWGGCMAKNLPHLIALVCAGFDHATRSTFGAEAMRNAAERWVQHRNLSEATVAEATEVRLGAERERQRLIDSPPPIGPGVALAGSGPLTGPGAIPGWRLDA